jgi:hypothetical protein
MIMINDHKTEAKLFKDLKAGDAFKYDPEEGYFMKISSYSEDEFNAVCLTEGTRANFLDSDIVQEVNAIITIL